MSTGNSLIQAALQKIGRLGSGDSPATQEQSDYLDELNRMLDLWNAELGPVYSETVDSLTWTSGNASRTIGTGGDFVVSRPLDIIAAQYRDAASMDYTLSIVTHREYQEIATKTLQDAIPGYLAYNPTYPTGTLFLWPIPSSTITLRLTSRKPLAALTGAGTVSLPPGWEDAVVNNLAWRLCDFVGVEPTQTVVSAAQRGYAALQEAALQFNMAKLDPLLPGQSRSNNARAGWNI